MYSSGLIESLHFGVGVRPLLSRPLLPALVAVACRGHTDRFIPQYPRLGRPSWVLLSHEYVYGVC